MKKSWEIKDFEDCLDKVAYTEKIQRKDFLEDGEFPVISQEQEFINGYWNNSDSVFRIKKPVIIFGDHTQVLKYVNFDFVLGADGVKILQPIDKLNAKYFYYFLNSVNLKSLGYARHYRLLKEVRVSIPPFPEQQRLVALLDEVFAAIATAKENADRNLQNARELFEVVLQNEFEKVVNVSEVKKLGEACSFSQGIQVDVKNQNEQKKDNQVRFLRIIDFTQGNEPPRYIDNPGEKYIIKSDDVSLVRYGATTGFVCSGLEGALANNLFRVIPESNKISKEFLYWFLRSPVFQNEIAPSINGAAMPAISFGLINDIKFPILLLAEQRAIVGRLEALSAETKKLEAIYQQKLTNLEELKKSVLQKAFKGEL